PHSPTARSCGGAAGRSRRRSRGRAATSRRRTRCSVGKPAPSSEGRKRVAEAAIWCARRPLSLAPCGAEARDRRRPASMATRAPREPERPVSQCSVSWLLLPGGLSDRAGGVVAGGELTLRNAVDLGLTCSRCVAPPPPWIAGLTC